MTKYAPSMYLTRPGSIPAYHLNVGKGSSKVLRQVLREQDAKLHGTSPTKRKGVLDALGLGPLKSKL